MIICTAVTTESQRELINAINIFGSASNLAYNETILLRAKGDIDIHILKKVAARLAQRHDSLRMTFSPDGTTLSVHDQLEPLVEYVDLSKLPDSSVQLETLRREAVSKEFNIENGPLLKLILVREEANQSTIIVVVHHLVCDGWSLAVLLEDLALLYSMHVSTSTVFLAKENYYIDYIHALDSEEYHDKEKSALEFWTRTYSKLPDNLELPTDYPVSVERKQNAGYQEHLLDADFVQKLRATARQHKCSLVILLLHVFAGLMNRLTGNESIVVALPAAGQAITGLDRVIGHCVNTLPILININDCEPMQQQLVDFRDSFFEQTDHQHITQGGLLKRLPLQRGLSSVALASVMFNLDQDMHSYSFGDIPVKSAPSPRLYEYFDLFLNVADNTRELTLQCQFNKGRFKDQTILSWLGIYQQLLEEICLDASRSLAAMPLLPKEKDFLPKYLASARGVDQSVPELMKHLNNKLVNAKFKIAINSDGDTLNYQQLLSRSNHIARLLIENGVKPGGLVGVCLDRNTELIPCLLGIWKAGAGYVPLDPAFPPERLVYMVQASAPAVILIQPAYQDIFSNSKTLLLDSQHIKIEQQQLTSDITVDIDSESCAYVIFTSGSTGKPKGVQIHRRAVANFLSAMSKEPGLIESDHLLAVTTLSFDISVLELILPLWVGASVVLATSDDVVDGNRLLKLIKDYKITCMQATPSTWKLLLQAGWQGSQEFKVLCGGEAFPADLVAQLVPICRQVWNMYGPTETTVWSTCQLMKTADSEVSIGHPIANTQCYIVDAKQQLLPIGIPGELLIGGDGLAVGYIGQDDLTSEMFIDNPFGEGKLYRTGDKVRWKQEGVLEYFGRMDSQVKLRGYRIELGEIEVILRNHPNVKDCALGITNVSESDQRLVAYVVPQDSVPELPSIKVHLAHSLPAYMLPNNLMILDALPQTLNGKLDRKSLAKLEFLPDSQQTELAMEVSESSQKLNTVQSKLLPIWQEVLQTSSVRLDDNFFDLGGHSILIAQLIARIEELLLFRLSYREIYSAPTLRKLATVVENKIGQSSKDIPRKKITKRLESEKKILSFSQQRLWFMEKLNGPTSAYNLPTAFRFQGKFNVQAFNAAFSEFVSRQEMMRSSIAAADGVHAKPVLVDEMASLPLLDWSNENKDSLNTKFVDYYLAKQKHAFSLEDYPLYIAELIKFSDVEYVLFFMPHHAIFDGGSFDIFVHEITTLYSKHGGHEFTTLPALPIQYTDFAAWNVDFVESVEAKKQMDFWIHHLSGDLQVLELPTDFPRPENDQSDGGQIEFKFEDNTIEQLTQFCKQNDVSIFMVLLATYGLMLHKFTGQTDLIIGAPVADRNKDVESLIGLFVNPLPLRINLSAADIFLEYLHRVKDVCLQALDNSEVPFEKLVEVLNPLRDLSRSPIFQTSITYQDVSRREQVMGDIDVEQINIPFHESGLDFNMWLMRRGDSFDGGIVYTKALFKPQTIERLAGYYRVLLKQILADTRKPLSEYTGYDALEYKKLLTRLIGLDSDWQTTPNLVSLLESPLTTYSEKTAAICGNNLISFSSLDTKSNQLANYLIEQGVQPGDLVGISMDRSIEMLVVLLGILKAGAAYLPLDPDFPINRLQYMVKDSDTRYIIGGKKYLKRYPQVENLYPVEDLPEQFETMSTQMPRLEIESNTQAYVIYTSGSTGLPKGVVVPHGAVVNFLTSMALKPGMTEKDILLAVTTLSFDIAVLEIFLPILTGATVVIAEKEQAADGKVLGELIDKHNISVLQATPATWQMLFSSGWQGASRLKALSGGEALPRDLAKDLLPATAELWNMYGPTETTVWSTCFHIQNADEIYLGTPIANTQCYLLDASGQLVPEGAPGELCIGGDGVTHGYHQRDELTNERFISNSFTDGRLYKTGDKVRFNSNGQLEYMGRMDQQIKLRGYRIEIGEIESQLLSCEDIETGAVVLQGEGPLQKLIAFYTLIAGTQNSIMKIRKHMAQNLPKYMLPEQFIAIDVIPLTPNGKVDRKKLSDKEIAIQSREVGVGKLPTTVSEKYYADLWCRFLKLQAVGVTDNFFDVGGHSLLSLEVANYVKEEHSVIVPPRVFVLSTLGQIASAYPVTESARVMEINDIQVKDTKKTKSVLSKLGSIFKSRQ